MKKTSFESQNFGTGAFLKVLLSSLVLMLLVAVQGTYAQVSSTLQANVPGSGGNQVDADALTSKDFVVALINADFVSQQEALQALTQATKQADVQRAQGNLTPAEMAGVMVRIEYWQYLHHELANGAEIYQLMSTGAGALNKIIQGLSEPVHGLNAAQIYQETIDLLSI